MDDSEGQPTRPRLATSASIPRAVEFLIHLVLRWAFFGLAGVLGSVSIAAYLGGWPWLVVLPGSFLAFAAFVCGAAIQPQGKLRFDRVGPSVIVTSERSTPKRPESADGP